MKRFNSGFRMQYLYQITVFVIRIFVISFIFLIVGIILDVSNNQEGGLNGFMGGIYNTIIVFVIIEFFYQLQKTNNEENIKNIFKKANRAIKDNAELEEEKKQILEKLAEFGSVIEELKAENDDLSSELRKANYELIKLSFGDLQKAISGMFDSKRYINSSGYIDPLILQSKIQNNSIDDEDENKS